MTARGVDAAIPATPARLGRQLGLLSVTALVIGEVIAVGIFLAPAGMARALGWTSPGSRLSRPPSQNLRS